MYFYETGQTRIGATLWQKPWLYENGEHLLSNEAEAKDYTLKMKAFFDFYLKGGEMPQWMKPCRE